MGALDGDEAREAERAAHATDVDGRHATRSELHQELVARARACHAVSSVPGQRPRVGTGEPIGRRAAPIHEDPRDGRPGSGEERSAEKEVGSELRVLPRLLLRVVAVQEGVMAIERVDAGPDRDARERRGGYRADHEPCGRDPAVLFGRPRRAIRGRLLLRLLLRRLHRRPGWCRERRGTRRCRRNEVGRPSSGDLDGVAHGRSLDHDLDAQRSWSNPDPLAEIDGDALERRRASSLVGTRNRQSPGAARKLVARLLRRRLYARILRPRLGALDELHREHRIVCEDGGLERRVQRDRIRLEVVGGREQSCGLGVALSGERFGSLVVRAACGLGIAGERRRGKRSAHRDDPHCKQGGGEPHGFPPGPKGPYFATRRPRWVRSRPASRAAAVWLPAVARGAPRGRAGEAIGDVLFGSAYGLLVSTSSPSAESRGRRASAPAPAARRAPR